MSEQDTASIVSHIAPFLSKKIPSITSTQIDVFARKYLRYLGHLPSLPADLLNQIEATLLRLRNQHSSRSANAMDREITPEALLAEVERDFHKEFISGLNLYTAPPVSSVQTGNTSALNAHHFRGNEILKSHKAKELLSRHQHSHSERGNLLKSSNEALDFSLARPAREDSAVKVVLSEPKYTNFLNVKPADFSRAFLDRYESMETQYKSFFLSKGISLNRIEPHVKSFEKETVVFGRITLDSEGDLALERAAFEMISTSGKVVNCLLSFATCTQDFTLFPNMYIAVEVEGDFYDEDNCLRVKRIYELDSHLDADEESISASGTVEEKCTILAFRGPYTFDGNAYFAGFDLVLYHVREAKPTHVILMGPFIPEDQTTANCELEFESILTYQDIRSKNLERLHEELYKINNTIQLIIVPDPSEVDNHFPCPTPNKIATSFKPDFPRPTMLSSPGLFSLFGRLNIAVCTHDLFKAVSRYPHFSSNQSKVKRFVHAMRSVVSQHNLHPAFPVFYPFDVTQIASLDFTRDTAPAIFIIPSSLTTFACKSRGTLICNGKSVFEGGSEFGSFIRISVDTGRLNSLERIDRCVRVDIVQI
mgnify:FL=1